MEIAIPLYDRFTALDAVGPYEVLWRVPGARVRWIGAEARPYATDRGLQLVAEATFEEVASPDVLVVPGGTGTLAALEDRPLLDWIRRADATTSSRSCRQRRACSFTATTTQSRAASR